MDRTHDRLTVLQGKFAAYLSWSQPFIHQLINTLGEHVRNVVVCNRTENLDRFPTEHVVRFKTRYLVTPTFALLASSYLQKTWNPRVMHAHFGWSGVRMLLLKQFLHLPLVVTFGGRDVGVQMHMPYFDELYRVLLDATDQIICVSEDLKRQLVEHGVAAERIEVIRRGTNLRRFDFVDRADRDPDATVKLLMVGRCVEKKGHRYVFEALAELVRDGAGVHLTIVGEGEEYHHLRRLRNALGLKHIVDFAGVTNHEGVRQHMADADIFLQCSVTGADGDCEGIPNVVVEAAATGLPVLGTRHGGIVEPVQHERNGLLVEERDVPGMIESLRRLLRRRDERLALGAAGAKLMRADWDLDQQVAQHLVIYERLAAEWASERRLASNVFIPPGFHDLAAKAIQFKGNSKEFSLAELAQLLFSTDRLDAGEMNPDRRFMERVYDLKRFVPQPVKFPVKVALGRILNALVELKYRGSGGARTAWAELRRQLDERVLGYIEEGGDIAEIDSDWSVADLQRRLPRRRRSPRGRSGRKPEPLEPSRAP